jgi:hypothetical protein
VDSRHDVVASGCTWQAPQNVSVDVTSLAPRTPTTTTIPVASPQTYGRLSSRPTAFTALEIRLIQRDVRS